MSQAQFADLLEELSHQYREEASSGPYTELGNIMVCLPKQQKTGKNHALYSESVNEWSNFILLLLPEIEYHIRKKIINAWEAWIISLR